MIIKAEVKVEDIFQAAYPQVFHNQADEEIKNIAYQALQAIHDFFYQLLHTAIGLAVVPAQFSKLLPTTLQANKSFLQNTWGGVEAAFKTADGLELDGMYFQGDNCQPADRTMILFNPNGLRYEAYGNENSLLFDLSSWQTKGWNVLVFNYRGVGKSQGWATRDGLILDGDAAFQYVKNQFQVDDEKILLHGHSLGAAIAAEVAALHPDVNYCNDRSFSSLAKEVEMKLGRILGPILSRILTCLGWVYQAYENWEKINGRKWIVYHNNDGMIPLGARFHELVAPQAKKIKLDEMGDTGSVSHMRKYNVWEEIHYFMEINKI